jgi:hypothetical protein
LGVAVNAISHNFGSTPYFKINDLQITDCKNIIAPGFGSAFCYDIVHLAWKQDTSVVGGQYNWFTNSGTVHFLYDPNHIWNSAVSELTGPDAWQGVPVDFVGGSNCVQSYDYYTANPGADVWPTNGANYDVGVKVFDSPVWFNAPAAYGDALFASNSKFNGTVDMSQAATWDLSGSTSISGNMPSFSETGIINLNSGQAQLFLSSKDDGVASGNNDGYNVEEMRLRNQNSGATYFAWGFDGFADRNEDWALSQWGHYIKGEGVSPAQVGFGMSTNGMPIVPVGLEFHTNGTFNLSTITNAIWPSRDWLASNPGANWVTGWIGYSNTALVTLRLSNGVATWNTLMQ